MNKQDPKAVQSWIDSKLVVSGSLCRLIDKKSQKNTFQFKASSEYFQKCSQFFRFGRIA